MKKIKVLHVSETFVAGIYNYIRSICEFTSRNSNIETIIIYSPNREGTENLDIKSDFAKDIKFIPLSMQREISFKKDLESLSKLTSHIKRIKPDVIHLHSSKAGVLGRFASKAYPIAKVYYTPNGYSFLRKDISKTKQYFFKVIEFSMSKLFGGITIACGDTEYLYAQKLGRSIMVRNGVSLEELTNVPLSSSKKLKTIVTIGRISAQKNPELFNDIAVIFPELKFIWIGDGELRHKLNANNIDITGWLDRDNAFQQMAKYDVYIQTSLWEGLPLTIIEAMARKKPIIATNVIGNKDAVTHGNNGFLCNTLIDFENAIRQLKSKPQLLKSFGEQSERLSKEKFDRDINFKKLIEVYFI